MSDELKASTVEAIGRGTTHITLIEPGPKGPIVLEVTSMSPVDIFEIAGGVLAVPVRDEIPPAPVNALAAARKEVQQSIDVAIAIARRTIVSPPFYFGGEDEDPEGKARFSDLSFRNVQDFVHQIAAYSGAEVNWDSPEGRRAVQAARFPENPPRP